MKLKTSITILGGCLLIFLFIMLPIVLSIQEKKEDIVASYAGSSFTLMDVNNEPITEKSFQNYTTTPLVPTLQATIQNPANLVEGVAANGWIRGGLPSREITRDQDYISRHK